ncbi:PEPxxWA-CTERM sorting domain-containing protein [Sandaracinobacter sp. RS1-74]|uniref:PEPxxWA-CTERM sorting domain-containing protein n=1 Tax=Sandaracinobacteroides sayramensis TaxID=2913411 RepID=UPI001EDB675D|nr:PEPxxWA-CTERM sorting domain-containing protein [Sandaracinobacteroides sayramensis]MCG2840372.1 PEPxxWA-CTERM sorting domain-containing protein [Sandaracinobacteroides sayramensis]
MLGMAPTCGNQPVAFTADKIESLTPRSRKPIFVLGNFGADMRIILALSALFVTSSVHAGSWDDGIWHLKFVGVGVIDKVNTVEWCRNETNTPCGPFPEPSYSVGEKFDFAASFHLDDYVPRVGAHTSGGALEVFRGLGYVQRLYADVKFLNGRPIEVSIAGYEDWGGSCYVFFSLASIVGNNFTASGNDVAGYCDWDQDYFALSTYAYGSGRITQLYINNARVPEPATWAMMITGFGAIGLAARRRRKQVTSVQSV